VSAGVGADLARLNPLMDIHVAGRRVTCPFLTERILMGNQSQQSNADQPPVPGGDPDQPPSDLPTPKKGEAASTPKGKDKTGYAPIATEETPRPEGAPKPHQIF